MAVEKNIRIQTFSKEGFIESDRMVKQFPEFYAGPKGVHNGPLRIEFTLEDQDDTLGAIEYLRRISGDLPLKVKGTGTSSTKKVQDNDDTFDANKQEIINNLVSDHGKNQDDFIKALRTMGFIFVTSDFLKFIIPDSYKIKSMHKDKFQWLIRRTKEAKDPKNDKYDPQVLLGVQIMDKRSDRIVQYFYGEPEGSIHIPVPEKKPMKLAKTNLMKFPHYMNEEERLKYGQEHRLLFNNPEKKPSKFYMRWFKDVTVGDELLITGEDINNRLNG